MIGTGCVNGWGLVCHSHPGCELASAETPGTVGPLGAASGAWRQVSGTHGLSSSLEANRKILISLVCMIPASSQRTAGGWEAVGGKELGELRRREF